MKTFTVVDCRAWRISSCSSFFVKSFRWKVRVETPKVSATFLRVVGYFGLGSTVRLSDFLNQVRLEWCLGIEKMKTRDCPSWAFLRVTSNIFSSSLCSTIFKRKFWLLSNEGVSILKDYQVNLWLIEQVGADWTPTAQKKERRLNNAKELLICCYNICKDPQKKTILIMTNKANIT